MVSERDYARVSAQKWYARENCMTWYACNRHGVAMHRYIMRAPKGRIVDHIDGNGLNNVRENLRLCTTEQNNANRRHRKRLTCFRGVWMDRNGWRAVVSYRGQKIYGDYRETQIEAARDYDAIKVMLYGEFALTYEAQGLYTIDEADFNKQLIRDVNR